MQAVGQIIEGSSYLAQGKYNQAVGERNALNAERDAAAGESAKREEVRKALGDQLVQQGASGLAMGSGSAVDQLMDSQVNGMLDALSIRRQGATVAASSRQQGQLAKMTATTQATKAYFGAAKSLTDMAKNYAGGAG